MAKIAKIRKELAAAEAEAEARRKAQARARQAAFAARRQAAGLRRVAVWVNDADAELVKQVLVLPPALRAQLSAALRRSVS